MRTEARRRASRTHRLLGMILTVPIVAWVLSSFVLHSVGLVAPAGLQGVYRLRPYSSKPVRLDRDSVLPPADMLRAVARGPTDRVYGLRLTALAGRPVYIVRPSPFELERVYDARTGARLDPLPIAMLTAAADEELAGTRSGGYREASEFNRYYALDEVPVVTFRMEGEQPAELVLSRASGRVLRRSDRLAVLFDRAYRMVHVWQWGDLRLFTGVLYGLAGATLLLVSLGALLWYDRRERRRRARGRLRPARRIHATIAPVAGVLLASQVLVGSYLWLDLGPLEPRFRGQGSFHPAWSGGMRSNEQPATAAEILAALPDSVRDTSHPVQAIEWRAIGDRRFWVVYPRRNAEGILLDARTGKRIPRLAVEVAARAAEAVVAGSADPEYRGEAEEYWMDLNLRIPTYVFRFDDPDRTDVYVSEITGEVVQRRPAFWRGFEPFLTYHTFAFTGHPVFDTMIPLLVQSTILTMVVTGWRMARPLRRGKRRRNGPAGR